MLKCIPTFTVKCEAYFSGVFIIFSFPSGAQVIQAGGLILNKLSHSRTSSWLAQGATIFQILFSAGMYPGY